MVDEFSAAETPMMRPKDTFHGEVARNLRGTKVFSMTFLGEPSNPPNKLISPKNSG